MSAGTIRIVLAHEHAVVRAGLKALVASAGDISVVGEAEDGREAVSLAIRLKPDVVVMDSTLPELDGPAATKEIVARVPETRVLVLTMQEEEECVAPILEAGAAGYLLKSEAHHDLAAAIRAAAHGDPFARAGSRVLPTHAAHLSDTDRFKLLTSREQVVLTLTAQGYSAPEIGARLSISPKTVDTYKQRIHDKLGFTHRSQYVQFALRLGLLSVS
jgi:two-component system response regulator NreC